MLRTYKPIRSEGGELPSMYTGHTSEGVQSRLSVDESQPPKYNGATIEDMRGNPIYDRLDKLDRIGKVRKQLEKRVADYAKSDIGRTFMNNMQHDRKPKS